MSRKGTTHICTGRSMFRLCDEDDYDSLEDISEGSVCDLSANHEGDHECSWTEKKWPRSEADRYPYQPTNAVPTPTPQSPLAD